MYASGEIPMVGDVVEGSGGKGEVLEISLVGLGGEETATVQWTTPREKVPGSGIFQLPAPVTVPTRSLTRVRGKAI